MLEELFKSIDKEKIAKLSSLELAYLGDAVYELMVREHLLAIGIIGSNKLHRTAIKYVCADTQAKVLHSLMEYLTEDELKVAKRGRNAKSGHSPKGSSVSNYRYSTGMESMVGYLFLQKRYERLQLIMRQVFDIVENNP